MTQKTSQINLAIAIITSIFLNGCNTVRDTGYLSDYSILKSGKSLEKTWVSGESIPAAKEIRVAEIDIEMIGDAKGITAQEARAELRRSLQRFAEMYALRLSFDVSTHIDPNYELKVAITEMTPGSAAARIWAGELGAGHARVQVEGRITKLAESKEIFVFSDRRGNSGTIGFADFSGDAGPSLVEKMLYSLAEDIILEIKSIIQN